MVSLPRIRCPVSLATRGLHSSIRSAADYALTIARAIGLRVTVTSTKRGWSEQLTLRRRYEDCLARGERVHPENPNPGCRYPANRPGDSAHNYGLAWDSWTIPEHMPLWTYIRRQVGFVVPDHDQIHAEYPNWRNFVS